MKKILFIILCLSGLYSNLYAQIPPVSDPVCAYCGVKLFSGYSHSGDCPYSQGFIESAGRDVDYGRGYVDSYYEHTDTDIYFPPATHIRDTEEGQAILSVARSLGAAVGEAAGAALCKLFDKIYDSTHKEYHGQGWGNSNYIFAVTEKNGMKGIWNNRKHNWQVKPIYSDIYLGMLNGAPMRVASTGKWGLYDVEEKRVVVPFEYDECKFFEFGGMKSEIALGKKDAAGNMHWTIGMNKYPSFEPYAGDYSYVELTSCCGDRMAMLVKDYNTGKSKILRYGGETYFSYTINEDMTFDDIILTGMSELGGTKDGDFSFYTDYYVVGNGGKRGYIYVKHTADMEYYLESRIMLDCSYDNVTPLATIIPGNINKNYVITQKNGKYGLGPFYMDDVKEPGYDSMVMAKADSGGKTVYFFIVRENGTYVALKPDGWRLYYPDGNSYVKGNSFEEAFKAARAYYK